MATKVHVSTQLHDKGAKKMRAAIERFKGSYASAGIHADAGVYETEEGKVPVPVYKVAWWLENGTQHMPARPFFYPTLQHYREKIARMKAQAYAAVAYKGADVEHALAQIGFAVQSWVQNTIKSNVPPQLSEAYLRRRRERFPEAGARTLIASGLLLRSVRYKVSIMGGDPIEGPASGPEPLTEAATGRRVHAEGREGGEQARATARAAAEEQKNREREQKAEARRNPEAQKARFNAQRRAFKTHPGRSRR